MGEFNQDNPKFIAYVNLLDAMCKEGILRRDPKDNNAILVYRSGVDESVYGVSEGWFSQNIFDAAQEAMESIRNGDRSLLTSLEQSGYAVTFTEDGDFGNLTKKEQDRTIYAEIDSEPEFEAFDYKGETEKLLRGMSKANKDRVFKWEDCEFEADFVGFLHSYKDLADKLPKDFTIIDIGANQAVQSEYFKDFANYIAVEPSAPESAMAMQLNMDTFKMTGQEFIKDVLPRLQEAGLDLNKTFCVCSYVPDVKLRDELIPETFPYYRSTYAGEKTHERIPDMEHTRSVRQSTLSKD